MFCFSHASSHTGILRASHLKCGHSQREPRSGLTWNTAWLLAYLLNLQTVVCGIMGFWSQLFRRLGRRIPLCSGIGISWSNTGGACLRTEETKSKPKILYHTKPKLTSNKLPLGSSRHSKESALTSVHPLPVLAKAAYVGVLLSCLNNRTNSIQSGSILT